MTQELLARFEKMSEREILISACSKIDNLKEHFDMEVSQVKERIDRHSAETDMRIRQDTIHKDNVKKEFDAVEKRVSKIEERHDSKWEMIKNCGSLIGYGSGVIVLLRALKG